MAITNGYATRPELENSLANSGITFKPEDELLLDLAINAASRWIDERTSTRFYASTETRYYQSDNPHWLSVNDILSITTLKTDDDDDGNYETVWSTTDWRLTPPNAPLDGHPYTRLEVRPNGLYTFPSRTASIEIVGSFGFNAGTSADAPSQVKQACLLIANRLWRRKDAVFGVAGAPALGVTTIIAKIQTDSDVMALIQNINPRLVGRVAF